MVGVQKTDRIQGPYERDRSRICRRQIEYKARMKGIEVVFADLFFPSSKTCSNCGSVNKDLQLKDRIYTCTVCGHVIDRDLNASINLADCYINRHDLVQG